MGPPLTHTLLPSFPLLRPPLLLFLPIPTHLPLPLPSLPLASPQKSPLVHRHSAQSRSHGGHRVKQARRQPHVPLVRDQAVDAEVGARHLPVHLVLVIAHGGVVLGHRGADFRVFGRMQHPLRPGDDRAVVNNLRGLNFGGILHGLCRVLGKEHGPIEQATIPRASPPASEGVRRGGWGEGGEEGG